VEQPEQSNYSNPDQERDLCSLAARCDDAVLVLDGQGVARLANPAAEQLFGRPVAQLVGQPFGFPLVGGAVAELEIIRPDGSIAFAELRVDPASWCGEPAHVATLRDITACKREAQLLVEAQQLLRSALDTLSAQVAILDRDGAIAAVNGAWRRRGREPVGAPYLGAPGLAVAPELAPLAEGVGAVLRGERDTFDAEYAVEEGGARRWFTLRVARCGEGHWGRAVVAHEEITERKQARHDPLTGLANRLLFDDRLHQTLEAARSAGQLVGVLFIDLDRFKQINDTLGHAAGDDLLVQIARRIERCVRAGDLLARRGGDEFLLALPDIAGGHQIARVAGRIHELLRQPFTVAGQELFVSASIGAAIYPLDGEDADTLQRNADAAMYRAKSTLRNSFQLFDARAHSTTLERLRLENSLRRAVEREELRIHYQPKVDQAGGLVGAEALLRWQHPELGTIAPSEFIPLAEELGLIVPIGEWCIAEICRQLNAWDGRGLRPTQMAVNISAVQFAQPGFLPMLTRTLAHSGIDPARLELELTESMLMGDTEAVTQLLRQLRALRLTLAIDDFGTGFSSLGYLQRLPISVLKVDRSFVGRIGAPDDEGDRGIVGAIITLGHHLQMRLVAEGVETEAQRRFLAERGCDIFQGFLFSRPLPPEQFELLLR
jgi:diguanylate cyclase (GGDEF)-like protein